MRNLSLYSKKLPTTVCPKNPLPHAVPMWVSCAQRSWGRTLSWGSPNPRMGPLHPLLAPAPCCLPGAAAWQQQCSRICPPVASSLLPCLSVVFLHG